MARVLKWTKLSITPDVCAVCVQQQSRDHSLPAAFSVACCFSTPLPKKARIWHGSRYGTFVFSTWSDRFIRIVLFCFLVHLHLLVGGNFRWQFSQFFDFHPHQYLDGRHERSTAADAFFVGRGYAGSVGFRSLHGGPGSQFNALFIFTKHADLCCLLCSMGGCSP